MLYTHVSHISAKIMHQLFCHLFSNNPLRHHVVHIRCDVTSTKEILSVIKRRITNHAIMHVSYQVRWHALTGSDSNMQVRRKSCWLSALQQLVSLGEQAVLHYLCYIFKLWLHYVTSCCAQLVSLGNKPCYIMSQRIGDRTMISWYLHNHRGILCHWHWGKLNAQQTIATKLPLSLILAERIKLLQQDLYFHKLPLPGIRIPFLHRKPLGAQDCSMVFPVSEACAGMWQGGLNLQEQLLRLAQPATVDHSFDRSASWCRILPSSKPRPWQRPKPKPSTCTKPRH